MKTDLKEIACCRAMYEDLLDGNIIYDNVYNSMYYPNQRILAYCPHCGTKLANYSEEYYDALEIAMCKDFCDIKTEEIPEEFKSDIWWKKRHVKGIGAYWENYDPILFKNNKKPL